jgi:hypothetical protein
MKALKLFALLATLTGVACGAGTSDSVSTDTSEADLVGEFRYDRRAREFNDTPLQAAFALEDGSTLIKLRRVGKLRPNGQLDTSFGAGGWAATSGDEVWVHGDHIFAATKGNPSVSSMRLSDGSLELSFGTNGVVALGELGATAKVLRFDLDAANNKISVLVATEWQRRNSAASWSDQPIWTRVGPKKLEVIEIDTSTGARSSSQSYDLPDWDWTDRPSIHVGAIRRMPDGSSIVLVHGYADFPKSPDVPNGIGVRMMTLRLTPNGPVTFTELTTGSDGWPVSFGRTRADGSFDVLAKGSRYVRFRIGATGQVVEAFDGGIELPTGQAQGGMLGGSCVDVALDGDDVLVAHSKDGLFHVKRYSPNEAPVEKTAPVPPHRCLQHLYPQPSGRFVLGEFDTNPDWTWGWGRLVTVLDL